MISSAGAAGLSQVAVTPAAGIALINGQQNLLTWTAPNDGQLHTVILCGFTVITGATQVGGQLAVATSGGSLPLFTMAPQGGSHAVGQVGFSPDAFIIGPGQTFTFKQNTALTASTSTVYAALWAA